MSVDAGFYVQKLRNDHKAMVKVLFNLDKDIRKLQGLGHCETAAITRICNALQYLQGYPEILHHPFEDKAFQHLVTKGVHCDRLLETLLREHEYLEHQTANLLQGFNECLQRSVPANALLIKGAYDYINAQLAHHQRENTQIFPLLERHLDIDDWQSIELSLVETPRHSALHRHYDALFNRLVGTSS